MYCKAGVEHSWHARAAAGSGIGHWPSQAGIAGFDYRRHWGSLQIMGDVVPRPRFGEVSSRRDIRVDGSLRLTRRWDLLLGYNDVQEHYERNTGSAGLRYTLGRSLRFDIRGTAAGKRELGFQLGLQMPL